jgi:hypothetical protein
MFELSWVVQLLKHFYILHKRASLVRALRVLGLSLFKNRAQRPVLKKTELWRSSKFEHMYIAARPRQTRFAQDVKNN